MPKEIELLAPARDIRVAMSAIACGADAIYIGAPHHGARAAAAVSLDDIRQVVAAAHPFGVKVYVALNTIIYENELTDVESTINDLYRAGVDAIIVQDMAITAMKLPPIALHASTQCDIRTPEKAMMLRSLGFTRIVPARELSIEEMSDIHKAAPDLEIEAFVHGALCVCFSGDCRASYAVTGRSANRGECSQMCRHSYSLLDSEGNILVKDKYLLSLKDLNRTTALEQMLQAGVTSLKIEGRLKDSDYVMDVVGHYRRELDRIINKNPDLYRRASHGCTQLNFNPDIHAAFNRGFTQYFTGGHTPGGKLRMATLDSPGRLGMTIGTVRSRRRDGSLTVNLRPGVTIGNGDGISWTDPSSGKILGMRINRAEGDVIYPAPGAERLPKEGTALRKTSDATRARILSGDNASRRFISVAATLRIASGKYLALDLTDERGIKITSSVSVEHLSPADKPQESQRQRVLEKTGGTIYSVDSINDQVGNIFIPASILTHLRRDALQQLDFTARTTYRYPKPGKHTGLEMDETIKIANIANHLARDIFQESGVENIEEAIETSGSAPDDTRVMTTRYCIRRELGRCLRTPDGKQWKGPLTIVDASGTAMRVEFDCTECAMNLYLSSRKTTNSQHF